jgi:broad specificity phosphatase PhoE
VTANRGRRFADVKPSGRLLLVRHGESEGNRLRRFSLSPDIDLTERGVEQARETGRRIAAQFAPRAIVASSYHRAQRTAALIAEELGFRAEILVDPDLRERSIGDLAGHSYDSLHEHPTYDPARFWEWRPPGGESLVDVQDRAGPALDRIATAHPSGDVLVVSHGGVMLALCAHVEGAWTRLRVARNCELVVVGHGGGAPLRLLLDGETSEPAGDVSAVRGCDPGDATG